MSETPAETEPATQLEAEHDAVLPMPGAPITVHADWHNAPGTGAYESPPVEPVTAYEKGDDGQLVAKVLTPPKRPRPTRGRTASTKQKPAEEESDGAEDVDGEAD